MRHSNNVWIVTLSLSLSTTVLAADTCNIDLFEKNSSNPSAVMPNDSNIYKSPDAGQSIFTEKRLPCTSADLLALGFEIKVSQRYGPRDSTNGGFEDVLVLQKGKYAVFCYSEFALRKIKGKTVMNSGDIACQQLVQPRLFAK